MQIFSVFMFAGIFTTLLIPETKRKTLEEICAEIYGEGIALEERALKEPQPRSDPELDAKE